MSSPEIMKDKKIFVLMKNKNLLLTILIVLFLFLRFYQLPRIVNFSMDQGTTLLTLYNLWQEKKYT